MVTARVHNVLYSEQLETNKCSFQFKYFDIGVYETYVHREVTDCSTDDIDNVNDGNFY